MTKRERNERRARGTAVARLGLLLGLLLGAAVCAADAWADACADCPEPTMDQLRADGAFSLSLRNGVSDYVLVDAGECSTQLSGLPDINVVSCWLVLRASGEVWNCPHSKSMDTISVTSASTDSQAWALTVESAISTDVFGSEIGQTIISTLNAERSMQESITITKQIIPNWCHRVSWAAYFEVGRYQATVEYKLMRRYAWWTKNTTTGSTVHNQGNVFVTCQTGQATAEGRQPENGYFQLGQKACQEAECQGQVVPKDLGFFPPLPDCVDDGDDDEGDAAPAEEEPEEEEPSPCEPGSDPPDPAPPAPDPDDAGDPESNP